MNILLHLKKEKLNKTLQEKTLRNSISTFDLKISVVHVQIIWLFI